MKNKLIVIEGTDGSGKKTQADLLLKYLQSKGENVIGQSFPNYENPACAGVKMYLNGNFGDANSLTAYQANALYAVDRLCTMEKHKKHIADGGCIIFDRYVQSTMLHQAGLISDLAERDRFLEYVDNFEFNILKLPRPDVVIFLDIPVEFSKKLADARAAYKSGNEKDIYEADINHLKNAYNAGKYVAEKYGWLIIQCLDENGKLKSIEQIHNEIVRALEI